MWIDLVFTENLLLAKTYTWICTLCGPTNISSICNLCCARSPSSTLSISEACRARSASSALSISEVCRARSTSSTLSISEANISCERRRALDFVNVAVMVYGMSVWTPAQAKYLAQPAELCQRTPAYCQVPGRTYRHVSSLPFLVLCLTIRQSRLALASPSSPACCIKCWCVKLMGIINK
jgi:hypothetical protein